VQQVVLALSEESQRRVTASRGFLACVLTHRSQEQFKQALDVGLEGNARFNLCRFFFSFFLLSQVYGLFPFAYDSRYPRQVSEDDHSCVFPNSDEPDVYTAFMVKMVDLLGWDNS